MARPAPDPEKRALEIVNAAISVFAAKGFRQAQMSDIARQMGASPGTLYNMVSSKDVLFEAALSHIFGLEDDLPTLLAQQNVDVVQRLQSAISRVELYPKIAAALACDTQLSAAEFHRELTGIVTEQYDFMVRNGNGVRILEKSTDDFPELSRAYFGFLRAQVIDRWDAYIARAKTWGLLADISDTTIAARTVIEALSWWAIRMPTDPGTEHYNLQNVRSEVIAFAVRGIVKG